MSAFKTDTARAAYEELKREAKECRSIALGELASLNNVECDILERLNNRIGIERLYLEDLRACMGTASDIDRAERLLTAQVAMAVHNANNEGE